MYALIGASGFVGSAVGAALTARGVPFQPIRRDNYEALRGRGFDVIINADGSGSKLLADRDPLGSFEANVLAVFRSLHDFAHERYVLISTVDVYEHVNDPALNGEDTVICPDRLSRYGHAKYLAELCVRRHASRWVIARLGGMVGPGLKKNVVFDLVHEGRTFVSLDSQFQFIETSVMADTVLDLAGENASGVVLNVTGPEPVSVAEIAALAGVSQPEVVAPAPWQTYHVNVQRLLARRSIPSSREAVIRYIALAGRERLGKGGAA